MQERFIVTGGAGFIGTNFLRLMVNKYPNSKFVNVDKLTYAGNISNLKDLEKKENYTFVQADICDRAAMEKVIQEGDIIVNFAAESHVDNSLLGSEIFMKTNILGTHNLLEVARIKKVKLFVQISTDEVYGSLNFDQPSTKETDLLNPGNPYSASKAAAEMICRAYYHTYKLPLIITRSSNNYGPYQSPEKVIPVFVSNIMSGKKIPLYGSGKNVRDWIFVEDNCEGIDFVIRKGEIGEVYNIGGGNEIPNIELTMKILDKMGVSDEFIEHVNDRVGHDLRYSLDTKKIRSLGWKPKFDFDEALGKTIDWYKRNEDWVEEVKNKITKRAKNG